MLYPLGSGASTSRCLELELQRAQVGAWIPEISSLLTWYSGRTFSWCCSGSGSQLALGVLDDGAQYVKKPAEP
jgi:predicted alpha/beta hydrolase